MAIPGHEAHGNLKELVDARVQVQPNGVDLTVRAIYRVRGCGLVGFKERTLPEYEELDWGVKGEVLLSPGAYIVEFNEIVSVPRDQVGMLFPRSTLLRMGCDLRGALWDSGYVGRSRSLLLVYNPVRMKKNARIGQIIFFKVEGKVEKTYSGAYQHENVHNNKP